MSNVWLMFPYFEIKGSIYEFLSSNLSNIHSCAMLFLGSWRIDVLLFLGVWDCRIAGFMDRKRGMKR